MMVWRAQIKYYAGRVLERMGAGLTGSLYGRVQEARGYGPDYVARMNKTKNAWGKLKVRYLCPLPPPPLAFQSYCLSCERMEWLSHWWMNCVDFLLCLARRYFCRGWGGEGVCYTSRSLSFEVHQAVVVCRPT